MGPALARKIQLGILSQICWCRGIGIQDWSAPNVPTQGPEFYFNSAFNQTKANRYVAQRLSSQFLLNSIVYNNTTPWNLIQYFVNDPIEECYTCLRIDPLGRIMPTLVLRQTAFNTDSFINEIKQTYTGLQATSFFSVPRWRIDESMIVKEELTKTEALRVNFLMVYGQDPLNVNQTSNTQELMAAIPPYFDKTDIQRHTLKMFFKQMPVKQVAQDGDLDSAYWTSLLADQMMGGQEKVSGTLTVYGIQPPICEGDNLEYDGNLYHIERVMHRGFIDGETGKRKFVTTLNVSNGLAIQQPDTGIAYPILVPFAPSSETLSNAKVDPGSLDQNYQIMYGNMNDEEGGS